MVSMTGMDSTFEGSQYKQYSGSSYATYVDFDVYKKGVYFDSGQVKYITDFKWGQTYTTTYVHRGIFEELFIAPKALNETSGEVSIYVRTVPFITFIWGGLFLMLAGMIVLGVIDYSADGKVTTPMAKIKGTRKKASESRKGGEK